MPQFCSALLHKRADYRVKSRSKYYGMNIKEQREVCKYIVEVKVPMLNVGDY